MKMVICPNCGNIKRFREWALIHRTNFFVQDVNGRIIKESCEEKQYQGIIQEFFVMFVIRKSRMNINNFSITILKHFFQMTT